MYAEIPISTYKYLDRIMCTFFTLRLPFEFAQDRLFRVTVMLSPSTLLRINSVEAPFLCK